MGGQTGLDHRREEEREAEASTVCAYVVAPAVLAGGAEKDETRPLESEPGSAQSPNGDTCEEPCLSHRRAETRKHKQLDELT